MGFISMLSQQQSEKLLSLAFFQPSREDSFETFSFHFSRVFAVSKYTSTYLVTDYRQMVPYTTSKMPSNFFRIFPHFLGRKNATHSQKLQILQLHSLHSKQLISFIKWHINWNIFPISCLSLFLGICTNIYPSFFIQPFIAEPFTYEQCLSKLTNLDKKKVQHLHIHLNYFHPKRPCAHLFVRTTCGKKGPNILTH